MNDDQRAYALVMGQVIAQLRRRRGLSQAELAASVGVAQATISRIEHGQLLADVHLTGRLAQALGVTRDALLAKVDTSITATRKAAQGAQGQPTTQKFAWSDVFKVAGLAGLAGLVAFGVAAVLSQEEPEDR